jgi:hypothetical protein
VRKRQGERREREREREAKAVGKINNIHISKQM